MGVANSENIRVNIMAATETVTELCDFKVHAKSTFFGRFLGLIVDYTGIARVFGEQIKCAELDASAVILRVYLSISAGSFLKKCRNQILRGMNDRITTIEGPKKRFIYVQI